MNITDIANQTKDAWKKAIEKELRGGKTYESLISSMGGGIEYEPIYHPDDRIKHRALIDWKDSNDWQAIEWSEGLPSNPAMKRLVTDDMHGLYVKARGEQLGLLASTATNLKIYVELEDVDGIFGKLGDGAMMDVLVTNKTLAERKALLAWNNNRSLPVTVITAGTSVSEYPVQDLTLTMQDLIEWLDMCQPSDLSHGALVYLHLDQTFLMNIAKIRALKKLLRHLWYLYALPEETLPKLLAIADDSGNSSAERSLITLMVQASSASIAGIDALTIVPPRDEAGHYVRKSSVRSIHHLLKMEAYLDRVVDPMAGSYFIEQVTTSMAEGVWSRLQVG